MIFDLLRATIELGLPLALMSWLLFTRMFLSGEIDRGAGRKAIERHVKAAKKTYAKDRKQDTRSFAQKSKTDIVFEKWMYFGSGFYGLAAFWTLLVIEVSELIGFVFNFPGFAALFADGVIALLFSLAMGQLGNLVSAFVWFGYWEGSFLILLLVAYAGYWAGIEAARRKLNVSMEALLAQVRRRRVELASEEESPPQ